MNHPLNHLNNLDNNIKIHTHDGINSQKINVDILKVFTSAPTHKAVQGTIILMDDGTSTRKIYAMLNGVWYGATLT